MGCRCHRRATEQRSRDGSPGDADSVDVQVVVRDHVSFGGGECRAGGRYHTFHVPLLQDKDDGGVSGKYHYITLALATGTIADGTLGIGGLLCIYVCYVCLGLLINVLCYLYLGSSSKYPYSITYMIHVSVLYPFGPNPGDREQWVFG